MKGFVSVGPGTASCHVCLPPSAWLLLIAFSVSPYFLLPFHRVTDKRPEELSSQLLTSCVILNKLLNRSEFQFFHLQNGGRDSIRKVLSFCDDFLPILTGIWEGSEEVKVRGDAYLSNCIIVRKRYYLHIIYTSF